MAERLLCLILLCTLVACASDSEEALEPGTRGVLRLTLWGEDSAPEMVFTGRELHFDEEDPQLLHVRDVHLRLLDEELGTDCHVQAAQGSLAMDDQAAWLPGPVAISGLHQGRTVLGHAASLRLLDSEVVARDVRALWDGHLLESEHYRLSGQEDGRQRGEQSQRRSPGPALRALGPILQAEGTLRDR